MVRVAVIVGKMNSGGKKNLIMEYYRHIDRSKVQFDFLCDADSEAIPKDEIEALGGKVYLVAPYQRIFANIRDIYKICKVNRYPILHAYNSTMNVFSLFAGKLAGVPVRINESISMGHKADGKNILKKLLRPFSGCFSTRYMANGVEAGKWQFGEKNYAAGKVDIFKTVINAEFNRFQPELREKTRKEYGWENKIIFGHIARFTAQKNPLFMLEIFSAAAKKEENAFLCLIGDGELKDDIMKKIESLGIRDRVHYLGRREDIQQFYNAMDAFLLPSLYEGLPVVGLEAECCGLPMFFSDEISRESSACELGHFISLDAPAETWADEILLAVKENISVRRSRAEDIVKQGFDSTTEAIRLQNYYLAAVR